MSELSILQAAVIGLLLTVLIERLLVPRPNLRRPLNNWWLHAGLWCVCLAVLYALTARPLFSAINVLLLWLLIVMVSNAKYHSLREPFVCADFEYFSDAVRFPRLYLPFFGFGKAALLAVGFLVYLWAGLTFEPEVAGGRSSALWLGLAGLLLLRLGHRRRGAERSQHQDDRRDRCRDAPAHVSPASPCGFESAPRGPERQCPKRQCPNGNAKNDDARRRVSGGGRLGQAPGADAGSATTPKRAPGSRCSRGRPACRRARRRARFRRRRSPSGRRGPGSR